MNTKYELVSVGRMRINRSKHSRNFYQLKALIDIPEYDVKAGDLGGFVTHRDTLSPNGSCWIGENAQAIGKRVRVKDHAYVGGNAVVQSLMGNSPFDYTYLIISGFVSVTEEATVVSKTYLNHYVAKSIITDKTQIYGNAFVDTVTLIKGGSKIYGSAKIDKSFHIDNCEIYETALIGQYVSMLNSSIYGSARIELRASVSSSSIYGDAVIEAQENIPVGTIIDGEKVLYRGYKPTSETNYARIFSAKEVLAQETKTPAIESNIEEFEETSAAVTALSTKDSSVMKAYHEVCESIDSYRNDIVKIIKHPVMTDKTDEHTLNMMFALKTAQRLEDDSESQEFKDSVAELEKAFMKAESNARRISSSLLTDSQKKKTEKARDLFKLASDESSSEQEKKVAFVQGFKQLDGVLDIPEEAVDTFRIKLGLKEIEM